MSTGTNDVHDIIIIGAGPCGLSVAARLCEPTPSALFTDNEHQRYHWMRSNSAARRVSKLEKASRRSHTTADRLIPGPKLPDVGIDMVVLDAQSDSWMNAWSSKFEHLQISHLRSPMFFHPDPRDRDGLLGFAYKNGIPKKDQLREITNVTGKELSKHQRKSKRRLSGKRQQETVYLDERERHDYYRPSQELFKAYCEDVIARYNLSNLVQKSEVSNISFDAAEETFTLQTSTGVRRARIVILATGPTAKPSLPIGNPFTTCGKGSVGHAFSPAGIITASLQQKINNKQHTTLAVIGGGLTSAQVSALAVSAGVSRVYQFSRGPLKTKHFDVDLEWVAKFKNYHLAAFWNADTDVERWQIIQEARGGGSVNPEYKRILCDLVKKEKLVLCERTAITKAVWNDGDCSWALQTEPRIDSLPPIDHVVYATGVAVDTKTVPMLQNLFKERDLEVVNGLPCLTNDLMWDSETPLFFTGRLAGLRLGPGAGNLEGARQGAERIAWKVGEMLGKSDHTRNRTVSVGSTDSGYESVNGLGKDEEGVDMRRLGLGQQNQFAVLGVGSD